MPQLTVLGEKKSHPNGLSDIHFKGYRIWFRDYTFFVASFFNVGGQGLGILIDYFAVKTKGLKTFQ